MYTFSQFTFAGIAHSGVSLSAPPPVVEPKSSALYFFSNSFASIARRGLS